MKNRTKNDQVFQTNLTKLLDDADDRRERAEKASSTGRHEPTSIYDGLYTVDEIDDGGRIIMRVERGVEGVFVPVTELSGTMNLDETDELDEEMTYVEPATVRRSTAIVRATSNPAVLIRRGA